MPPEITFYISKYGYLAIFVLIFLQETGVPNPVPNELVLMFSGYLIYSGILHFPLVLLAAVSADFIGTNILYVVFYFFGAYIIRHKPRWIPISQKTINKLTVRMSEGGIWMIYLGRLTPFIRGYTSVTAGLLQLSPRVFLPVALISALTWSGVYVITGKLLGPYWNSAAAHFNHIKYIMLIILLSIIVIVITTHAINKYLEKKNEDKSESLNENIP